MNNKKLRNFFKMNENGNYHKNLSSFRHLLHLPNLVFRRYAAIYVNELIYIKYNSNDNKHLSDIYIKLKKNVGMFPSFVYFYFFTL